MRAIFYGGNHLPNYVQLQFVASGISGIHGIIKNAKILGDIVAEMILGEERVFFIR